MRRRSFLASILAAGVAPAAVGSGVLMPVRKLALLDPREEPWASLVNPMLPREHPYYDADPWDEPPLRVPGDFLPFTGGPRCVVAGDRLIVNVTYRGEKIKQEFEHNGKAVTFTGVKRDPATGLWIPV